MEYLMLRNEVDYRSFVRKLANIAHLIGASICADTIKTKPTFIGTFWLEFPKENKINYSEWLGKRYIVWFHTVITAEQKKIITDFSQKFFNVCEDEKCLKRFKQALVGLNNANDGLIQGNDKYLREFTQFAKKNIHYYNVINVCMEECDSLLGVAKSWYLYSLVKPDKNVPYENVKGLLQSMKANLDLFEIATDEKFQHDLLNEESLIEKKLILENELQKMNALISLNNLVEDAEKYLFSGVNPKNILNTLKKYIKSNSSDYLFKECIHEYIPELCMQLSSLISDMKLNLDIYYSIYGEVKYDQASAVAIPRFN